MVESEAELNPSLFPLCTQSVLLADFWTAAEDNRAEVTKASQKQSSREENKLKLQRLVQVQQDFAHAALLPNTHSIGNPLYCTQLRICHLEL